MIKKMLDGIGQYFLLLKRTFWARSENTKLYWKAFFVQWSYIGINMLPIVFVVSAFLGVVTMLQVAYQIISPITPLTSLATVSRDIILLELSPTIVTIILSGVVGSKMAAEIGHMRISEQIDALESMGINAAAYLIRPKIIASLLSIPMLISFSIIVAILSARFAGAWAGILSTEVFDVGVAMSFRPFSLWYALIKSFTFAFVLSSVSAYFGYTVHGGALKMGKATTTAVVVSVIIILLADYVLTAVLL